jgi:hypothetical protein
MTGVTRLGGAMTDPTGGDLRAASGGRRNMPLVPVLVSLFDPMAWLEIMANDAEEWRRENLYGWPPPETRSTVRIARIDLEAGAALGFNVNSDAVGH